MAPITGLPYVVHKLLTAWRVLLRLLFGIHSFLWNYLKFNISITCTFSALIRLGVRKSMRPVKIELWGVGYLSGARCRLFAYGPADATPIAKPHHLAWFKFRLVLPFLYRFTPVVLEKRSLNGCSSCTCTCCLSNNNNNDRLTAFDPGQPG